MPPPGPFIAQIEPPTMVKDLNFQNVPFPYSTEEVSQESGILTHHAFLALTENGLREESGEDHLAAATQRVQQRAQTH